MTARLRAERPQLHPAINQRYNTMQPMTPVTTGPVPIDLDPEIAVGFDHYPTGWDDDPAPVETTAFGEATETARHEIDVDKVRVSVTSHVAAILDTIESRTGSIPSGEWWDHALVVAGHPRWDPTVTATLHLPRPGELLPDPSDQDKPSALEALDALDNLDGLRTLLFGLIAVSVAALLVSVIVALVVVI